MLNIVLFNLLMNKKIPHFNYATAITETAVLNSYSALWWEAGDLQSKQKKYAKATPLVGIGPALIGACFA